MKNYTCKINKPELKKAASDLLSKIKNEMFMSDRLMMREYAGDDFPAYLWPFSVLIEAMSACADVSQRGGVNLLNDEMTGFYKTCIDEILPKYMDRKRCDYRVYNSTTDGGDPFYDDDAWIALEYIRAAEIIPEKAEEYMNYSEETAEYCFSGEDEKLGGGIYWKEHKCSTKNTCINAPAIILACELYKATKKSKYLEKAKSLYEFTKKYLFDPETGVYNDNVNADTAKVDKAKYTYNSGTMICSGALLFEITGDKVYLDDAKITAEGSYNYFGHMEDDGVYKFKSDHPWFNSWLLRGYEELIKADPETDGKYLMSFEAAIDLCIKNPRADGYYYKIWRKRDEEKRVSLIDQTGTLKCFAILLK